MTNIERPIINQYQSISKFIEDRLNWLKVNEDDFSIRKSLKSISGCSPALVTQIIQGKRVITRDRVGALAKLLKLNKTEFKYFDDWIKYLRDDNKDISSGKSLVIRKRSVPQNHLLKDWLNVYVKDAAELYGFEAKPGVIFHMLGGLAPINRIRKALEFLLREGFLKSDIKGRVVASDEITTTSNQIPSEAIRKFHKKTFDIAKWAIDNIPMQKRKAHALTMSLTKEELSELQDMVGEFYEKLIRFSEQKEKTPRKKRDQFYQLILNLSPIGGRETYVKR